VTPTSSSVVLIEAALLQVVRELSFVALALCALLGGQQVLLHRARRIAHALQRKRGEGKGNDW